MEFLGLDIWWWVVIVFGLLWIALILLDVPKQEEDDEWPDESDVAYFKRMFDVSDDE